MAKRDDDSTQLSRALVALRKTAGLNQIPVSQRAGISQSQLSRIEQGRSLPTEEEAGRLLGLYEATDEQRDEILDWVRDARSGVRDERLVVQRGRTLAMQQRWRRVEGSASVVRGYQPAMVLGELQTPDYAAVVFGKPPDSPEVAERMERRRALLADSDRRHILVQTEGSLLFPVGSADTMARQLDSLVEASRLPNVELGVLTRSVPLQVTTPTGFNLYDDTTAVVGLKVAAATLTAAGDVATFRELFDRLAATAVFGEEARAELQRIAGLYR